ncbi:Lrp/AsnC family transcriptional regulator [Actinacidiphila glaucinigra]|uniref:Lrp/AsnC family transcriptional regulator n=1 Tax=Actinacidiphila glaucinigra TaxID=235986 RepID=UPI00386BE0F8
MDSHTLDELDMRLLHALQLDGRAPFSRIAEVLGVSDQTVARRYRRLRGDLGMRVLGLPEQELLGRTRWALRLRSTPEAAESLAKALARRDDTAWISLMSGGTEVMCVTRPRSHDEHDALLLGRLPRTPSIVEIGAHSILHTFYGGALGWFAKRGALTDAEVAALRPPPPEPPSGTVVLDATDEALLAVLARDGRASYPELHRATGLSESAAKRRLEQLRGSGVLYTDVQLDTAWVGHDTRAIFWITAAPSALSSVGQALAAHPETAYVAATTGSSNLVAVVICSSTPELYRYLSECVGALDGVRHVETVPSLRLVKQITTEGIR